MTSRTDLTFEYNDAPRVAEVAAPSTNINMQDLVDTFRVAEHSWQGLSFNKLLNASGKEDLGGGVKVGITAAMQNTLLAFAGRTTPAETGTVTSNPGSPITGRDQFLDTAADFVTAEVARGSLVINFTDRSVAEVITVDDLNTLTTKTLVNGIGNTYDTNDVYHVFNIIQCKADGGNLVAVDELQATIAAILPTAFTQVVLTSSSSATLQEQEDIQFASYSGGVFINPASPLSSSTTVYPSGTRRQPAETFAQAVTIANGRGLSELHLGSEIFTLPDGVTFDGFKFVGESTAQTELTVPASATADGCLFTNMHVEGTLDGKSVLHGCHVYDLDFVNGDIEQCGFHGTITLGGAAQANFIGCYSLVAGASTPVIDMGGSGQSLVVRGYEGGLEITNKTGADACSLDFNSGQITVDDTVTTGTVYLRGVAKWTNKNTYAGGATLSNELLDGIEFKQVHGQIRREIFVNPSAATNGNGYQQAPYDNLTDAIDDAEVNGITALVLLDDVTLDRTLKNFIIRGVGDVSMDANSNIVQKCEFRDIHLDGTFAATSDLHAHDCVLKHNVSGLVGRFYTCGLAGDIYIADAGSTTVMTDCYSDIGGLGRPTITLNTGAHNVSIRSYRGGLTILGVDNAGDEMTVSMMQGKLTLDSTCTDGVVSVRGLAQFTDNSAGTTVDTTGLFDPLTMETLRKLMQNRIETNPTTGIMTVYDDDDVTVLLTGNIYEDVLAAQAYRSRGMERRNRLT